MAPTAGNLGFWTGLLFLSRASIGSDADGHTMVGYLWVEHRSAGVGSIGIVPIGHVAYSGTANWKNRPEISLRVLGSTLRP